MRYFDAHNHLHDARLASHRADCVAAMHELPVVAAVVNGTREDDWEAVAALAGEHPSWLIPSFGIHPWYVSSCSVDWLQKLRDVLERYPASGVGEIGLDRWIQGHDLDDQRSVFLPQLALATELNRPATIHCLRAWGALWEIVRAEAMPLCGFLLHSYGGREEMVDGFVARGAYFSFSPYFLHPRKAAQRELFRRIPRDRLLVESDAPDMRPPDEQNPRPLRDDSGEVINHPANLEVAYRGLAELRGMMIDALAADVEANYRRLFAG